MSKRTGGEPQSALIKRARMEEDDPSLQQIVVASDGNSANKGALIQTVKRTSGLQAPIMCLQGHQGEVYDLKFSPDGDSIATCSIDKTVLLWKVYGDCKNYGVLRVPKGVPTSLAWLSDQSLVVGSSDSTVIIYDLRSGQLVRRFRGHTSIVNSVDVTKRAQNKLVASASDDGTVRVWSQDSKDALEVVELGYPITCVRWSDDGQSLYIGGVDNDVHVFSLASHSILYTLRGHSDTITSLAVSPNGQQLLSASIDSTVNLWNVQPFAPTLNASNPALHPRLLRSFYGAPAGFEGLLRKVSWSRHQAQDGSQGGSMVCIGGNDRAVTVWDASNGEIRYKLPGHSGTVVATDWSPKEPIVATSGVDGVIYLGEVEAR